jgi:hypothetical protein
MLVYLRPMLGMRSRVIKRVHVPGLCTTRIRSVEIGGRVFEKSQGFIGNYDREDNEKGHQLGLLYRPVLWHRFARTVD